MSLRFVKMFLLVLSITAGAAAQSAIPPKTGSSLTQAQAQEALAFHNKARREVGIPGLAWSPDLAAYAQAWANRLAKSCQLEHRSATSGGKTYGENLFFGSGDGLTPLMAAQDWYQEKRNYSGEVMSVASLNGTGHYTQMVWKASANVGIGMATCKGQGGRIIIVANYDPPGNYLGQKPY